MDVLHELCELSRVQFVEHTLRDLASTDLDALFVLLVPENSQGRIFLGPFLYQLFFFKPEMVILLYKSLQLYLTHFISQLHLLDDLRHHSVVSCLEVICGFASFLFLNFVSQIVDHLDIHKSFGLVLIILLPRDLYFMVVIFLDLLLVILERIVVKAIPINRKLLRNFQLS